MTDTSRINNFINNDPHISFFYGRDFRLYVCLKTFAVSLYLKGRE
jgi:uncharacterized membrane protein YkgB